MDEEEEEEEEEEEDRRRRTGGRRGGGGAGGRAIHKGVRGRVRGYDVAGATLPRYSCWRPDAGR